MYVGVQGRLVRPQPVDYGVVRGWITTLCGRYGCLRSVILGHSVLGREIPALVLGEESETRVLIASAFRGQEWFATLCALRLCEEMCSHLRAELPLCDISLSRAMHRRQIWFVPLVNPDGVEIARYGSMAAGGFAATVAQMGADIPGRWQGNVRGVDLYSNFTAGWEEKQDLRQKSGKKSRSSAEGQPETHGLAELCRRENFRHAVALCTQGERVGWYGGLSDGEMMARVLAAVSGYPLAQCVPMGFGGWFAAECGRPALLLQVGMGPHPLPLRRFETVYEQVREMLLISVLL